MPAAARVAAVVVAAFAFHPVANADSCTKESVAKLPGKWVAPPPATRLGSFTPTESAAALRLMDDVTAAVRAAVPGDPTGGHATSGERAVIDVRNGGNALPLSLVPLAQPFAVTFRMKPYICKADGTYYVLNESDTDLSVRFNGLWSHNAQDLTTIDAGDAHEEFFDLPSLPPAHGRHWDLVLGDQRETDNVYALFRVVAREGRFPLVPMSKAEYYRERIRWYQSQKQPVNTGMADMDKFNRELNAVQDQVIARFQRLLATRSAAELAAPALTYESEGEFALRPADVPDDRHAGYVFKWDKSYFRKAPSRLTPQFATIVYLQSRGGGPDAPVDASTAFYRQLERGRALDVVTRKLEEVIPSD